MRSSERGAMPSHKRLEVVVRGLVESFTSLMNYHTDDYVMGHVVRAARRTGATELRVDFVTGKMLESPLLVPKVRASLARYLEQFRDTVRRSGADPAFVVAAELVVTVDPTLRRPGPEPWVESPYTCVARITDDLGKLHEHAVSGWWYPEIPDDA